MYRESVSSEFGRPAGAVCAAIIIFFLAGVPRAVAQATDTTHIDAYLKAITQANTNSRLSALERFAAGAPTSNLKMDALEWIVWDEEQTHNDAAAAKWARELLTSDPDNALALAVLTAHQQRPTVAVRHAASTRRTAEEDPVQRGLLSLGRLRRPEGMSFDEFSRLRQYSQATLAAAAGSEALERKDYSLARELLGQAVAASPNDPRLVYALALADLSGDKPNRQQGYWLLARAVNLSGGPAAARDVEQFGRKKYKEDGGSDRDWEQYLANTAAPGASAAATVVATAKTAQVASVNVSKPALSGTKAHGSKTRATPASVSRTGWKGEPEPPAESTAAANSLPPISSEAAFPRRTGPRVSLGILLETSTTRKGTRQAIVNSLSDLVRRLGPEDEAFILSFSNDLVFEEDLTGDAKRLEKALDQIKPHPGTALLDAAGFAAGHLRRIAKNDSRVLLVISDGKNASSRIPTLASSAEIRASGVKIYCIGVDVNGDEGIYRLQGLASATGGTAAFITAPNQFRAAAQQVAGHIGIRFDY